MIDKTAWLKERKKGLGGSDVGAALGLNPYKSPYQLFLEKTSEEEPVEIEMNSAMEWGLKLENVIADEYMLRTGRKVIRDRADAATGKTQIRTHRQYPFLLGSIDRTIVADKEITDPIKSTTGVLEIKTVGAFNIRDWEDKIPYSYLAQLMHYLFITEREWGAFAILAGGREFMIYDVIRDDEFIKKQVEILVDFWENNVLKKIPPTRGVVDLEYIQSKPSSIIQADQTIAATIEELKLVKAQKKEVVSREKLLTDDVKLYMQDFEILAGGESVLCTWKTGKGSPKFDAKKFQEENPQMYEQYLVTKPGARKLLIKGVTEND